MRILAKKEGKNREQRRRDAKWERQRPGRMIKKQKEDQAEARRKAREARLIKQMAEAAKRRAAKKAIAQKRHEAMIDHHASVKSFKGDK